eukprot:11212218-Lingulodinium_polyedra.AAC.1
MPQVRVAPLVRVGANCQLEDPIAHVPAVGDQDEALRGEGARSDRSEQFAALRCLSAINGPRPGPAESARYEDIPTCAREHRVFGAVARAVAECNDNAALAGRQRRRHLRVDG